MIRRRRVLAIATLGLGGCLGDGSDGDGDATDTAAREDEPGDGGAGETETTTESERPSGDDGLTVTSAAFDDGESIQTRYTGEGEDVSPPLELGGVPSTAAALAIVVDDPDAPDPPFTHWLCWAIPPETTSIPEAIPQTDRVDALDGARQGQNDFEEVGYRGPLPPEGDDPHRYRFTVHALESALELDPGANRQAVDAAIEGSVLASGQLAGTYQR